KHGLDRPMVVQYAIWISNILRGDFGVSMISDLSVGEMIKTRVPITVHLGLTAFVISICLGIPIGIICAVRREKWLDTGLTLFANFGITVPIFWLGILMVWFFGLVLRILPVFGYTSPFEDFGMCIKQMIMPVFCLSIFAIASGARLTRSSMLEVMNQDYIRTAWSKGLKEWVVIGRHALKNGLIPVITLKGMTLRSIIGGSVLVETVFNIPGMGRLAVDALMARDYPIVQGVVLITALMVVFTNLMVDLCYGWLDPRIRYE
ncbi:ABC transporter permease, partial [Thermodesulfobacteriota bacterium]